MPVIDPSANAWEKGDIRQFVLTDRPDSASHKQQHNIR